MFSLRLISTGIVWCVATIGIFWLLTYGVTTVENRIRWYQACESTMTAKAWDHRIQTCGEFAIRQ